MKHQVFLLFILFSSICHSQDCKKLSNGTYKVELDSMFLKNYGSFEFIIADNICVLKRPTYAEQFNLTWLPNCGFRLKNIFNVYPHSPTENITKIGEPWFDIKKVNQDTVYFTYRLNLHIQVYSGKLIKTE